VEERGEVAPDAGVVKFLDSGEADEGGVEVMQVDGFADTLPGSDAGSG